MNESERLAHEITKALNGGAWHGPSWREALDGVSRDGALQHPIPEAHSIAEVLLHAVAWHDIVRRRLQGETPQEPPDEENWPKPVLPDDAAWEATCERLFATGEALVAVVAKFPPERLYEKRPNLDTTWYELVSGGLQHVLYHAGQVSVLKKARVGAAV